MPPCIVHHISFSEIEINVNAQRKKLIKVYECCFCTRGITQLVRVLFVM